MSGDALATRSSSPLVSVIVTAWHGEAGREACLSSLGRMSYPPERREILVADVGASGVSVARNQGIRASRGEVVAFTDADCVVSRRWLDELVPAFAPANVGAVGGEIVPYPGSTAAERYAARRRSHTQVRPLSHPLRPFAMTPNAAFRRSALDQVGLFDPRFPGGGWEDADLCWRVLRQTSFTLAYAPKAVVFHRYRATAREFLGQHVRYGHGLALLHAKYREELGWGWRERREAYAAFGGTAWRLAATALRRPAGADGATALDTAYFDFLRELGQRFGFLRGSLSARTHATTA